MKTILHLAFFVGIFVFLYKKHNLQAHNVVRIFTPSNKANKYHPPRASNWMADLKSGQIQNKGPLCGHICCCVLQILIRMHSVSVNTKENLTFEQTLPSLISLWLSTVWQSKKEFQRWAVAKPWQLLQGWRLCGHICGGTIQHELHQEVATVSSTFPFFTTPPPSHPYFYSVLITPLQAIWSDK